MMNEYKEWENLLDEYGEEYFRAHYTGICYKCGETSGEETYGGYCEVCGQVYEGEELINRLIEYYEGFILEED